MDLYSSEESVFFCSHFRMGGFKAVILKCNMVDDAHTIGKNGKFIGIVEMSVDVETF